ncbi:conserved hypothetical protein [Xenorhabdus nematophila F1]|uniref:Uncharacterized protein n=1 Tax=Xenorhabdus nematophila (strain ATCC 19061 / DSM 3370 / CCUG 14189 / LMG 1036 / NCIMB 9965 / AN6) TaxID=406817 RepID=D3VFH0_XENNA|nr:hypothetical protein XNC1_2225 [Xenorhabdus nematophila ATCC 19061]CCW32280.1 conserved hypothetical protein [Xenorhabdus nematophila F1]CEE94395.1 hypothetical protein XNA1_4620007 [Xenorhabdus nematophila str. Anatoliense]CEF32735.1 hypothetical protein XNW1_4490007 [Xenorhabdus nematophila str. Websteri]CEK23145.1 hypothetical protein XNC2_2151 [Xenorhabdus nematophila AN6/1]
MSMTDSWLCSANDKPQESMITKSERGSLSIRVISKGKNYISISIMLKRKKGSD